ncbi:MAG: cytochrome c [Campylobacterales bacterium]|nr:cytochrome c [Campylobacterales bacterium]
MRLIAPLFLALCLQGDATLYEQGRALYFEKGCNGCHGLKAEGMNNYPSLANRAKGFLAHRLERYRSGDTPTQIAQIMIPFAQPLSDAQIDALSTYLHEFVDEAGDGVSPKFQTWGDGGS